MCQMQEFLQMSKWRVCIIALLICASGVTSRRTSTYARSGRSCYVPDGQLYERSVYETNSRVQLRARELVSHDSRIIITCSADVIGDIIKKQYFSFCRNGSWDPVLPECIQYARCGAPDAIPGTTVSEPVSIFHTFPHGYVLQYACAAKAELTGSPERPCYNGSWTNPRFSCIDKVVCRHPAQENALYDSNDSIYSVGDTITIRRCSQPGMVLEGSPKLTCLPDGTWSGSAICRSEKRCSPMPIRNGVVFDRDWSVKVICWPGYMNEDSSLAQFSCADGQWTGPQPDCVQASCKLPKPKMMTSVFVEHNTNQILKEPDQLVAHGSQVRQYCKWGSKSEMIKSTCVLGRWQPLFQFCNIEIPSTEYWPSEATTSSSTTVPTETTSHPHAKIPSTEYWHSEATTSSSTTVPTETTSHPNTNCKVYKDAFIAHVTPGRLGKRLVTKHRFVPKVPNLEACRQHCLQSTAFICNAYELRTMPNEAGYINCNLFHVAFTRRYQVVAEDPHSIYRVYHRQCAQF